MTNHVRQPRNIFTFGGIVASFALVAIGIAAIVVGYQGRADVRSTLAEENIVGTADSSIPGQLVDSGSEARAFAEVMRKHTLASTDGATYSELPRYLDANGNMTNSADEAARTADGALVENPLRQLWITETALTTALNTAYFAEQVANFAMIMGAALLLTGAGFSVLTVGALYRRPAAAAVPVVRGEPVVAPAVGQ